jgi:ERF superfamily
MAEKPAAVSPELDLVAPPLVPAEERSKLSLVEKIHRIMMEVGYVQKSKKGAGGAEGLPYSFVSHDAAVRAVRPCLVRWGIVVLPRVVSHTQMSGTSNTTVADVEFTLVNVDKPDEKIVVPVFGYGVDKQDKGPGKAMSYAKKYMLLQVFVLETGDDPELSDQDREELRLSVEQRLGLYNIIASSGVIEGEPKIRRQLSNLAHALGFQDIEEVPASLYDTCRAQLEKGILAAKQAKKPKA